MIRLASVATEEALARLERHEAARLAAEAESRDLTHAEAAGYRHPHVKVSITAETCSKCAYCESKISHVHWGDVEHIAPKCQRPDLMFAYNNLTLACVLCNNGKGGYWNEGRPVINPYASDPDAHLDFLGALVFAHGGDDVGKVTIRLLQLNRSGLREARYERLSAVDALACEWRNESDPDVKAAIKKELEREAADCGEFAATVRQMLAMSYGIVWTGGGFDET